VNGRTSLQRRQVVSTLLAARGDALVVSGLGAPSWDVAAAGDHELNFYLWGAMGNAGMVGLGLALARPERRVLVITGDGEALMGLTSLATVAVARPANFALVVLDNERFGETGDQPTHTASGVDLAAVAAAAGFSWAQTVRDEAALAEVVPHVLAEPGPLCLAVKVLVEQLPLVVPPRDGAYLKHRFRAALLGPGAAAGR
jgi:thiamine pyrophosphate-dependent acetolactate synthase large subunit-like protein